ncbi:MAG: glycosyltransferase family 39 protein, partial [Patescibacteria group bacterium]
LTIIPVKIFGLNEFAVRFPSALLGVGAVIMVFFLTRVILAESRIALLASLLLAISPWHLQFTRTAYETGSLAFFTTAGLLFFLLGLKKKKWLVLSALFFGLELYLYQAAKVFVPLFAIIISIVYFKKYLLIFWTVFIIFLIPILVLSVRKEGQLRAYGVSIFQDVIPHQENLALKTQDWLRNDNKSAVIFHPELLEYAPKVITNYFLHLSPQFFFGLNLGDKVNYVANVGLMYLWELPFLLAGFCFLAKAKKPFFVLLAWVLLAPIPASITNNLPSSIRTATFLPGLQIITAIGLFNIVKKYKGIGYCVLVIGLLGLLYFLHMLFVHAPILQAKNWYAGYKNMVLDSAELAPKYDRVLVSNKLDQTLNFYQFFLKYDPQKFLTVDGGRISGGYAENDNHLANFYFRRDLNYEVEKRRGHTLFVGLPEEFPSGVVILKKYPFAIIAQ